MANYYFLGTLLPDLSLDQPPEISFRELKQLLHDNLSDRDYEKACVIRNFYDMCNLRFYWKGEPLDPLGNLNENTLEEALVTRTVFPPYVFQFADKYENNEEKARHFPELLSTFFQNEIAQAHGAFKVYLTLERDLRLILLAFRAKKLGRDVVKELQYENPEDEIVAQILAQKDAQAYEPPEKYADLRPILAQYYDHPLELQKALAEYRLNKIEEILVKDPFSINRILAYLVELIIVEKWQQLDKQKGLEIVQSMLKEPS